MQARPSASRLPPVPARPLAARQPHPPSSVELESPATQVDPLHTAPLTQSAVLVQDFLHAPEASQRNGLQSLTPPSLSVTRWSPSHVEPETQVLLVTSQRAPGCALGIRAAALRTHRAGTREGSALLALRLRARAAALAARLEHGRAVVARGSSANDVGADETDTGGNAAGSVANTRAARVAVARRACRAAAVRVAHDRRADTD